MLQIPTKMLILAAAVVWLIAGAAVIGVGLTAAITPWTLAMAGAAAVVYLLFLVMFLMIARKHIRRIEGITTEASGLFSFLDAPSWIIMIVMIGLGAILRISGWVPDWIIAFFYSGLGLALITAAIFYLVTYIAICDELR
jgi:hypothetical protein